MERQPPLARHLQRAIHDARYPLSPRLDPLKAILAKLEPPKPADRPIAAAESWHRAKSRDADEAEGKRGGIRL